MAQMKVDDFSVVYTYTVRSDRSQLGPRSVSATRFLPFLRLTVSLLGIDVRFRQFGRIAG